MKKILSITTMFLLSLILVSCNFLQFREYTITFETNGGSEVEPIKVEIGLTIPLDNIITNKDGYNFNGWFLDSSFEQPVSNDLLVFSNLKLYAKWVITRPTTNVNYELNGSVFTFDGNSSVYYIYFDGVLIHETNENYIDLANYKEQLLNDVELSILVNNQETLEAILSLDIKYEANEIVNEFIFNQENEFIKNDNYITDEEFENNGFIFINSNITNDFGEEVLKLIYSNNANKNSALKGEINILTDVKTINLNLRSSSLNELEIFIWKDNELLITERLNPSAEYEQLVVNLDDPISGDIEFEFRLKPSVFETDNSGVFIKQFKLLSSNEKYLINE